MNKERIRMKAVLLRRAAARLGATVAEGYSVVGFIAGMTIMLLYTR